MATIGIDLGTTNSCAATVEGGRPVIVPNAEGERTTPSVIAFSKEGERLVGTIACRQAAVNPDRTIESVKRRMGSDWRANIDGKPYSPQELSAMILRKLRRDAEAFLGQDVTQAVITVPAYFDDAQRQATKDAGRIAGLDVLRIINEPTAAALAYGLDNGTPQKVMVYDLGGGTFDVSVIEIGDDVIEVLATSGDNHLGGDDFDERVAAHLLDAFKREHGVDLRGNQAAMQRGGPRGEEGAFVARYRACQPPVLGAGPGGPAAPRGHAHARRVQRHDARSGGAHVGSRADRAQRRRHRRVRAGLRAAGGRLHAHSGRSGPCAQAHGQGAVRVHQPRRVRSHGRRYPGCHAVRHVDGPGEGR